MVISWSKRDNHFITSYNREVRVNHNQVGAMPLPKPRKGEMKSDFISRCMSNDTMKSEFYDHEQRVAVCETQ